LITPKAGLHLGVSLEEFIQHDPAARPSRFQFDDNAHPLADSADSSPHLPECHSSFFRLASSAMRSTDRFINLKWESGNDYRASRSCGAAADAID